MEWTFEKLKEYEVLSWLKRRLRSRGLVLDSEDGEIFAISHGPHEGMEFRVWIVWAKEEKNPKNEGWIALYPKAIYWLEDSDDWWKPEDEMRIYVKEEEE